LAFSAKKKCSNARTIQRSTSRVGARSPSPLRREVEQFVRALLHFFLAENAKAGYVEVSPPIS